MPLLQPDYSHGICVDPASLIPHTSCPVELGSTLTFFPQYSAPALNHNQVANPAGGLQVLGGPHGSLWLERIQHLTKP